MLYSRIKKKPSHLKALAIFGNFISTCMHKPVNIWTQLVVKVARDNWKNKYMCFQILEFETSVSDSIQIFLVRDFYSFLKNYVTSEEAVSHNVYTIKK